MQIKTKFYFATEEEKGYIDSLYFYIDNTKAKWNYHPEWIEVAKITLPKPLSPSERITI